MVNQPNIKADTAAWNTLWAMEANTLRNVFALPKNLPLKKARAAAPADKAKPQSYAVNGSTAIVPVVGPISKYPTLLGAVCGETSTLNIQANIQKALNDDDVKDIVLYIDSPGGTVSGTTDLATFIRTSKTIKPIKAFISDHCFSAGYWIASQCSYIVANEAAFVGSIGVFSVLLDTSEAAANAGVKVNLVSSGEYKGITESGLPIDDKALGETQRYVNAACDLFIKEISAGRNLSIQAVTELADGRIHIAQEAKQLELIDEIGTLEFAISLEGNINMSDKKIKASAADPVKDDKATAADMATTDAAPDISEVLKQIQVTLAALVEKVSGLTDNSDDDDSDTDGTPTEADDDADADASAKAVAKDRDRLKAINEAVGTNRADFAMKAFLEGKTAIEAKASLADVLNSEIATLNKKVAKANSGTEPLALGDIGETDLSSPDQLWAKNVDDVQTKYSGKKEYFLAALKHDNKKTKGTK